MHDADDCIENVSDFWAGNIRIPGLVQVPEDDELALAGLALYHYHSQDATRLAVLLEIMVCILRHEKTHRELPVCPDCTARSE
jgi:hypothetical protein